MIIIAIVPVYTSGWKIQTQYSSTIAAAKVIMWMRVDINKITGKSADVGMDDGISTSGYYIIRP